MASLSYAFPLHGRQSPRQYEMASPTPAYALFPNPYASYGGQTPHQHDMASPTPPYAFPHPYVSYGGQYSHHQESISHMQYGPARIAVRNIPEQHFTYIHVSPEMRDLIYSLLPEDSFWRFYWDLYLSDPPQLPSNEDQPAETGIPTDQHVLNSLPSVAIPSHDEADECAICMDNLCGEAEDETATQLPCGHMFHRSCVAIWLCNHNTCPLCRFTLPAADRTGLDA